MNIEPATWPTDPHYENLAKLLDTLYTRVNKPVTVSILESPGQPLPEAIRSHLFRSSQFVVIMLYDYAADIDEIGCTYGSVAGSVNAYTALATREAESFVRAMNGYGYGMIGIPAIATHHEFEYREDALNNRTPGGGLTRDYLQAALEVVANSKAETSPTYLGLSIWGFVSGPVGGTQDAQCPYDYYRYDFGAEQLALLKTYATLGNRANVVNSQSGVATPETGLDLWSEFERLYGELLISIGWGETTPGASANGKQATCQMNLSIYKPDGSLYAETALTENPQVVSITQAEAGSWKYHLNTTCATPQFVTVLTSSTQYDVYLPVVKR